jgi:hypothetical protein
MPSRLAFGFGASARRSSIWLLGRTRSLEVCSGRACGALSSAEAGPLTILGELVHNPTVLSALAARGIVVANDVTQVTTSNLMVTAHGASARALASTRALGLNGSGADNLTRRRSARFFGRRAA